MSQLCTRFILDKKSLNSVQGSDLISNVSTMAKVQTWYEKSQLYSRFILDYVKNIIICTRFELSFERKWNACCGS